MKYIIGVLDFFVSTIQTIWSFFTSLVNDLIMLVKYLGIVAELCYKTIAELPSFLQVFALVTVMISILYIILGRESGGSKQ